MRLEALLTIMATKKASALKAFLTGIVCVVMVGFSWLSDPTAADQTGDLFHFPSAYYPRTSKKNLI
jgi:hypothetical protein